MRQKDASTRYDFVAQNDEQQDPSIGSYLRRYDYLAVAATS